MGSYTAVSYTHLDVYKRQAPYWEHSPLPCRQAVYPYSPSLLQPSVGQLAVPELRLHQQEVRDMMQEMILNGAIVSVKDNIFLPRRCV